MSLFSFSQNSGWRSRLRDASFRGVPFLLDDDEGTFGRRVQVHEYPQRDKPFTEDLGRATRRISINAYLVGDDYDEQRNKLIGAPSRDGCETVCEPACMRLWVIEPGFGSTVTASAEALMPVVRMALAIRLPNVFRVLVETESDAHTPFGARPGPTVTPEMVVIIVTKSLASLDALSPERQAFCKA